MATFTYEALNNVGQSVKGEVDAGSSEEAIAKVRAMRNFPTKIKERAGSAGKKGPAKQGAAGARADKPASAPR